MIEAAFAQYLIAQGFARATAGELGDLVVGGAPALMVAAPNVGAGRVLYDVGLQLVVRAEDAVTAVATCEAAGRIIQSTARQTVSFTHPTTGAVTDYPVRAVVLAQRPAWFPTPEPGEQASCNFRVYVEEANPWH